MKLALIGRGRMGREVSRLAPEEGHEIVAALDGAHPLGDGPLPPGLESAEVAIDFTTARAVLPTVSRLAEQGLSMVVGTTGWYDELPAVRKIVESHEIGLIYAANFSVGANLFLQIVREAARRIGAVSGYDAHVLEHHHRGKTDLPSGTALRLAETIVEEMPDKARIQSSSFTGAREPDALHVAGIRSGEGYGRHVVGFEGSADAIELTHTARSREGFARGALLAAGWIRGRTGVFEFLEVFEGRRR